MKLVTVISFDVDRPGDDPKIEEMSKDELRKRLKQRDYGSRPVFAKRGEEFYAHSFVGLVVIEGRIITRKDL